MWRAVVNRSRVSRYTTDDGPGWVEAVAATKSRGNRRDNLKLNKAGKKKGVVCLAIQTVAVVRIACRHGQDKAIIAPGAGYVK